MDVDMMSGHDPSQSQQKQQQAPQSPSQQSQASSVASKPPAPSNATSTSAGQMSFRRFVNRRLSAKLSVGRILTQVSFAF